MQKMLILFDPVFPLLDDYFQKHSQEYQNHMYTDVLGSIACNSKTKLESTPKSINEGWGKKKKKIYETLCSH